MACCIGARNDPRRVHKAAKQPMRVKKTSHSSTTYIGCTHTLFFPCVLAAGGMYTIGQSLPCSIPSTLPAHAAHACAGGAYNFGFTIRLVHFMSSSLGVLPRK
mmetsp:Transcript_39808/g.100343  ORF Transcript_39808/g.100343 Transcript_39808/m.100343 type:complete len:103 (-) Transcript_39808:856-1164(-)